MNSRELEKALDIVSELLSGRDVSVKGANASLYEEYEENAQVYDMVALICKKLDIDIFEYNYGLYISPKENNKLFGYTNEQLKKSLGVKLNRELYLCYFIIYTIITRFYRDTGTYTFVEYIKIENIIESVDSTLKAVIGDSMGFALNEVEENSFKEIAMVWEDMPIVSTPEAAARASKGSKSGFVKLVLNFLLSQGLMVESEGRYYPKDRFKAIIENYFDTYKGRLYEILKGEGNATN